MSEVFHRWVSEHIILFSLYFLLSGCLALDTVCHDKNDCGADHYCHNGNCYSTTQSLEGGDSSFDIFSDNNNSSYTSTNADSGVDGSIYDTSNLENSPIIKIDQSSPIQLEYGETSVTLTGSIATKSDLNQLSILVKDDLSILEMNDYTDFSREPITTKNNRFYKIALDIIDVRTVITVIITATDNLNKESGPTILEIRPAVPIQPEKIFTMYMIDGDDGYPQGTAASLIHGRVFFVSGYPDPSEASINSKDVDIFYYYAATRNATLYSPDNDILSNPYGTGIDDFISGYWDYYNHTKLGRIPWTVEQFESVQCVHELPDAPFSDIAPDLQTDDVVAFETASGKKGIIMVLPPQEVLVGNLFIYDYITIAVKIEP